MQDNKALKLAARTLVIHPEFLEDERDPQYKLEEANGLAAAIALNILRSVIVVVRDPKPDALLGGGKIAELAEYITNSKIDLVFVNSKLTPVQQRNLEKAWNCKVIDRSGLILEIFGARARTAEGKLQVELAALEYQKSRLVRSWTHLERQRGGFGFLGGPGETQLELDKRMINSRIAKIKKELAKVARTRELHRKTRRDVPYTIIALVGYTNAGKSTLFNRLTNSNVTAEDKLFATLDPTMRLLELPSGRQCILSDTVGFISDLPHELVAAFRATLEEVAGADILHGRDVASPESANQKTDVEEVLKSLGLEKKIHHNMYEVFNKIDLLKNPPPNLLPKGGGESKNPLPQGEGRVRVIAVSALTGKGCDKLLKWLDDKIASFNESIEFKLKPEAGAALAWLYEHGFVEKRKDLKTGVKLTVNISEENAERFKKLFKA